MAWVKVGEPEVHRQQGKWVVRQPGYGHARDARVTGTYRSPAPLDTKRAFPVRMKRCYCTDSPLLSDAESMQNGRLPSGTESFAFELS